MVNAESLADGIAVELAWSPAPREWRQLPLRLPAGATVGDALAAAGEALPPAEGLPLRAAAGRAPAGEWKEF